MKISKYEQYFHCSFDCILVPYASCFMQWQTNIFSKRRIKKCGANWREVIISMRIPNTAALISGWRLIETRCLLEEIRCV